MEEKLLVHFQISACQVCFSKCVYSVNVMSYLMYILMEFKNFEGKIMKKTLGYLRENQEKILVFIIMPTVF